MRMALMWRRNDREEAHHAKRDPVTAMTVARRPAVLLLLRDLR